MEERLYWLGFSSFQGIGPIKFRMLLQTFWTAENAWHATEIELRNSGIGDKVTDAFMDFRKGFNIELYAEELVSHDVSFIIQTDDLYPRALKEISNPPLILYVKGNRDLFLPSEQETFLAVVGTRKVTSYGRHVTEILTQELASAGCTIVSGLAIGVDAIAHTAALEVRGKTIAVLGCGVDCCTPRENQLLYYQIVEQGGAIISEMPLSQGSFKGSFPQRNRIIAGMSHSVLVTEGAEDSGSLITANLGLDYQRNVFAVPGPITSSVSRGPISLLSKGAILTTQAKDILQTIGLASKSGTVKRKIVCDSKEEQLLIDLLQDQEMVFDELVRHSGLHPSQVGTLLSLMEMKGTILSDDQGKFSLA
jgi:DNA processing protein